MASRNRLSSARPTPGRSSVAPTPARHTAAQTDELPPYRKPAHPLKRDATYQLDALNGRDIAQLKEHNEKASKLITDAAGLINDKLREREEATAKQRKRWEKGIDADEQEAEEQRLARLGEKVDEATKQLEESMRAVIDGSVAAQRIQESLDWLRQNAPGQLEREYATQMSQQQSQRQSQMQRERRSQDANDDEDMEAPDEEADGPTPGPTPVDGPRPVLTGAGDLFTDRMTRKKNEYTSISFAGRYAKNNAYIGFKRMVHDARYQDDRPLPNPDTWFTETGSPAPTITNLSGDDDDIVMDRATISTRCPLTFQQFKEPYSSSKCPHTFEKNAILEMIRKSNIRLGVGRGTDRAVECPVAGCSQVRSSLSTRPQSLSAFFIR